MLTVQPLTSKSVAAVVALQALPACFHDGLTRYARELEGNTELDYLAGRPLLEVSFADVLDDDTPEDVVAQLARGELCFAEYPFHGIDWNMLGVAEASYACYLQAVRHLREHVPAAVVEQDRLAIHI